MNRQEDGRGDTQAQGSPERGAVSPRRGVTEGFVPMSVLRVLVGVGAPALLLALCLTLLRGRHLFCLFHELTGLYCPGCGSGRAALALLHGRVGEAFGHNALAMLFLLPCAYFLLREYLRFVFPGLGLKPTVLPAWAGWVSLALILVFWVLRNLPAFAFLAP